MKKTLLLFLTLCMASMVFAQVYFIDDFESYNEGDLIAASSDVWSTWSGNVGGSEDAPISTEQAFSGINSLKLESSSTNGGPQDVVLPFGGKWDLGTFTFECQMFVPSGKGAYFNFQAEETIGVKWALEFYFQFDGVLRLNSSSTDHLTTTYTQGTWEAIKLVVDLSGNNWELFVNDVSQGSFSNPNNSVASMDIFPVESNGNGSLFYMDDVSYDYLPPVLHDLDATLLTLNVSPAGLTGYETEITGQIRNLGVETINDMDITWTDGINEYTENYSGLDLASLEIMDFEHPVQVSYLEGTNPITVILSNPNAGTDQNPANNSQSIDITGYTPAPHKMVLVEEATGTWCGWCPRGAVFLDRMTEKYPDYFIGVAVHNGDPMVVAEYDDGIGSFPGFQGYPSVILDRTQLLDPSSIEPSLLPRLTVAPAAILTNGASYDEDSGELSLSLSAEFLADVGEGYKLNMIIVENGVTGTSNGYNQANYYSGGTTSMGGYENLPNPVPAAQMVYDHVGRAILGTFYGEDESLPASITTGETHIHNFSYQLPSEYNYDNIHLIGMLINDNGQIDNVTYTTINEAIANGLVGVQPAFRNDMAEVFPNPFNDILNIRLNLEEMTTTELQVFNTLGELVATRNYGKIQGDLLLPFDARNLEEGIYLIHIKIGELLITKKVIFMP